MSQLLVPRQLYHRVFVVLLGLTLLTVGGYLPQFRALEYHHRPDHCRRQNAVRAPLLHAPALQQRPHLDGLGGGDLLVDAALDHHAERLPDAQLASRLGLVMYRHTPYGFRAEVLPPHSALILRVPPADRNRFTPAVSKLSAETRLLCFGASSVPSRK
jgi:hypothetical protein